MDIFAQHGILSIVAHRDKPGMLMVRAVARDDLEHFWPAAKIVRTDDGDYLFAKRTADRTAKINDAISEAIDSPDHDCD